MITVVEEDELALICHLQGKQKKKTWEKAKLWAVTKLNIFLVNDTNGLPLVVTDLKSLRKKWHGDLLSDLVLGPHAVDGVQQACLSC